MDLHEPMRLAFLHGRPTRVIGLVPTSGLNPGALDSASVMPTRPSGGSMNNAGRDASLTLRPALLNR
jgi:hypothetical protein